MTRSAKIWRLLLGFVGCLLMRSAWSADQIRVVVAGSERSTNAQVVRDIAKFVGKPAEIDFDMRHAAGTAEALMRLRESSGLQFAVLQSDVAEAFLGAAARGNVEAGQLLAPVRVLAPLDEEDIYFIVRADSPLNWVRDIENARISVGPQRGDTALSVATLYRLMFNAPLPEYKTSFNSQQNALVKLTEYAVDVVALVAPRPARVLADMTPDARRFVKLLKFDPRSPGAERVLKVYAARTIPAAAYPNLLDEDLTALAVRVYLVSHGRNDALQTRFADAWCRHLTRLRSEGSVVLRGLEPAPPPLAPGWKYSRPFERELTACLEGKPALAEPCSQEERALGLCES